MRERSLLLVGPGHHFGYDLARRFYRERFDIGLIGRAQSTLDLFAQSLQKEGISPRCAVADVTRPQEIRAALETMTQSLPPVSCLIYNVKSSVPTSEIIRDPTLLTTTFENNVTGAFNTLQAAAKQLSFKNPLSIIVTGGGYKDNPDPDRLALSVSKAALHNLVLALAPSLQKKNITLQTIVIDGFVRETGPLLPTDVADYFWFAYNHPDTIFFRFPQH